ncbi:MAG: STAS domain-containing protein [Acidobacteria bacterium]|nr:STAS domain-containing protein [Acidobacteriota bacterium]
MTIKVRQVSNVAVLDLHGPLKMGEPELVFREKVQELLEKGTKNLAINLAGVPEMDSSGIGALVRAYTSVKHAGGKCKFFAAPKRIKQTLRMVRLDTVLELADTEATALASL